MRDTTSPPPNRGPRWSRRDALRLGGLGLAASLAGCGERARRQAAPLPTAVRDDPDPVTVTDGLVRNAWAGWTLRVAEADPAIRSAFEHVVAAPFAEVTGCTVNLVATDYARLTTSVDEGEPYVDLACVEGLWANRAEADSYLEPFSFATSAGSDVDIFETGTTSIPAYAVAMVNAFAAGPSVALARPENWAAWWDRTAFPGNRALKKGAVGTFEIALLSDGVLPADLYPLDFGRAIDRLRAISGRVVNRWWEATSQPIEWLAWGRADYASAWSHHAWLAIVDGYPLDWGWEQALVTTNDWVMPVGSRAGEIAADFVGFATQPAMQAAMARAVGVGPVGAAAFEGMDPVLAATLPTAPDHRGGLIEIDATWWATNLVPAQAAFNDWLLGV